MFNNRCLPLAVLAFTALGYSFAGHAEMPRLIVQNDTETVPVALLDGRTITYTLVDGESYRVSFEDGQSSWVALKGRREGQTQSANVYQAHKLDEGVYRVFWHEERRQDDYDFVTLLLNFKRNRVFAASLLSYGDNSPADPEIHFVPGIIHDVRTD